MERQVGSTSASKHPRPSSGVAPEDLADALGRLAIGDEKKTCSALCKRSIGIMQAAKQAGYNMCPVCSNYWSSVPYTRYSEVQEGLHCAIWEMEKASTELKKLAAKFYTGSDVYSRITAVSGSLDSAVERSREVYCDRSPSPSDVWEHWEEVWRLEDLENGKTCGTNLEDCDEDCVDDGTDAEWWEMDSEEYNDRRMNSL